MWPFTLGECSHEWVAVSTTFTPPLKRGVRGNIPTAQMNRYIYGFTTILQKCVHCGLLMSDDFIGRVHLPDFKGRQHEEPEETNVIQFGDIGDKTGRGHLVSSKDETEKD